MASPRRAARQRGHHSAAMSMASLIPCAIIFVLIHAGVGAALEGACSNRGTYNAADGTCTCDVGFGGDDCSINLLELSTSSVAPKRSLQEAPQGSGLDSIGLSVGQEEAAAADLLLPAPAGAADAPASVPFSLRNMLMYADTLVHSKTEAAAVARRRLLDTSNPADPDSVGCGFYDLFYEGCGTSSQCFYDTLACTPDAPFYDFYTGDTLRHAPETEYFDDFLAGTVFGDRGFLGKSDAMWSHTTGAVTSDGEDYLGGLASGTSLKLQLGDLPMAPHEIIMSFDFVVDGQVGTFSKSPVALTVLGEGPVEASAVLDVTSGSQAIYQVEFKFAYSTSDLKLKIAAMPGVVLSGTWGVDKVMISSMVTNYPPVAEDKEVHISPDPVVGGANTIELRGFDQECENVEYHITALPTEGKLFQCSCDSLWTSPITPSDLPATVPGPCHRLVYEPAANEPKEDLEGNPFDAFQYRVKDAYGEYSDPAFVKVYVDFPDTEDTPVSGTPGLAIACDGMDDIVSMSWALGEPGPEEFAVELRFKATGDAAGTLVSKPGSYFLGWTEFGGLGAAVHTSTGDVKAETLGSYTDRMWHHVVMSFDDGELTLYVDGEEVASSEGGGSVLADPSVYTTLCAQLAEDFATVQTSTAFNGHLDEVRFWSRDLDSDKAMELYAMGFIEEPEEEEGLVAYLDFNLGANVPVSSAVFDRTSAHVDAFFSTLSPDGRSAGLDTMFPTYVSSTAVYANLVRTEEDTPVTVKLHGGDLEGGVTFWVATMPLKGDLVDPVTGKTVLTSPAPVSSDYLIYHPKGSCNGKDVFKYQSFDGTSFSYKSGILLDIKPVNDPPSCSHLSTVITSTAGPTLVQLQGTDVDEDAFLRYTITRPPRRGLLFQSDINAQKLALIDESMTSVGSTSAFVLYEPRDVGNDESEGYPYDSFAYSVYDRYSNSSECVVDVSIPDDGCDPKPVSGDPGYALRFDGEDDCITFGALAGLMPTWPFEPAISLAFYFRTSYVTTEGLITLAKAGPFSLQMSKVYGLALAVGSRVGPTFEPFNEGAWHRTVLTFDGSSAKLYVDGVLKASLTDVELPEQYDDALILGCITSDDSNTGCFNGQIDEVSLWSEVIDAVGEDSTVAPNFSGFESGEAVYPDGVKGHWTLNEAQGVMVYNGVTGELTEGLGKAGMADSQPRWVASTVMIGNTWNVTEDVLEVMNLECSSEYTDTLDAVLLALPGQAYGGGRLWYTEDGVTPLYPITTVPTVLKAGHVIYESQTLGMDADYAMNYGDFAYVCIGDLQRTLTDHLSGFDFYGLSNPSQQSNLGDFLDAISDLIRNLPTPPDTPAPVVSDAAREIYATAPLIDQKALDNVLSFYGLLLQPIPPAPELLPPLPPTPKPKEPPTVEELAQKVLEDLIDSFFPALGGGLNGAAGDTKISAVNIRVVFSDLSAALMVEGVGKILPGDNLLTIGTPTDFFDQFLKDFITKLAAEAQVPEDQITILKVEAGSVVVEAKVHYSAANQAAAQALETTASTNGDALWVGTSASTGEDFTLQYGNAIVTDVSTDAVFVQVAANVAPSCFQLSQITVATVNVKHTNHMPEACLAGPCRISIQYGGHGDQIFEIDAVDADGDDLEVRITYLARKGTLLAPHGTTAAGMEAPVRGDLFDFYISREGSLVAKDPVTGKYPLIYSPQVNGAGMSFDSFGFVISDGTTLSKEYTVTIDVDDNALLSPLPTAGNTGYALDFDGVDDFATFGPVSAYGIEDAVTFALWIKTGSAATENGMTVLSAGKYKLYWSKLGGLTFRVAHETGAHEVSSSLALNDLFWHHVIAAYDGEHAMLYVDGMAVGASAVSTMSIAAQGVRRSLESELLTLGARHMEDESCIEYFNGVVDELVVFNKASANLMVSTAMMRRCGASHLACFEGDEDGLVGYWRFNEALGASLGSEVDLPVNVTEDVVRLGGSEGMAAYMPTRVASTVPLLNTVELLEDTEATFELTGVSHDLEDPTVHITFVPAKGRLYLNGTTRLFAGSSFPMSVPVTYKPKTNYYGAETFGYVINDGTMSSDVQVVQLVVHPQNDVPLSADMTVLVDFKDPAPVEIKLKGRDLDGDDTQWLVTVLPMHGTLYQSVDSDFETPSRTLTSKIVKPNSLVTSPVYYVPMVNDGGMQDSFGYVVEDEAALAQAEMALTSAVTSFHSGNEQETQLRPFGAASNRRLRSRMATVTLDGSAAGLAVQDTPVVGVAGLALKFDGANTVATLGSAADYGLLAEPSDSGVTLSAWFKTSAVTVENRMVLLEAGPYSLTWTKVLGLQFGLGDDKRIATYSAWNDGAWHQVTATFDGSVMTLKVDDWEASTEAEWESSWEEDSTVLLGAHMELACSSYYNGFVDDLVIGSSDAGFFRFNEAAGDVLVNAAGGVNGTLGMGGVASTQPERVASSAPISIGDITLEEDTEVTVLLIAHNADAAATGVIYVITEIPAAGKLYTTHATTGAKATEIKASHLPKSLAAGVDKVVFVPDADTFSGASTPYAQFSYAADIAGTDVSSARSATMTRSFFVLPVNDTPRLANRFLHITVAEAQLANVSLAQAMASDVETDDSDLQTMVTFLPAVGLLYQYDGTLITERNTVVTDDDLRLTYVPPPNLAGAPLAAFGFVVSDGELMSEAGTVMITVTGNSALDLSEGGSVFVGASGSATPPQLDGAFTVDAWVRVPNEGLAASVWAVVSTAFASLPSTVEAFRAQHWPATLTLVNPMPEFELGRWHHLAFVSKLDTAPNSGAMLYVDGKLIALQAVVHEAVDAPGSASSLVIGAPLGADDVPAAFLGKVDEVRVWSRGLLQYEVITSMNLRAEPALNSATGNEAVGKGIELYLAPDLHDSLVAYWSFDDVTDSGTVPEAVSGADGVLTGEAKVTKLHYPMAPASAAAQALLPVMSTKGTGYALLLDGEDDYAVADVMGEPDSDAGAAVELWFKTGNSLGFMALASVGGMSVHWTAAGGLGLHMASGGSIHTFKDWSDGAWHHVKATAEFVPSTTNYPEVGPGSWKLTLMVDDEQYGPRMAPADGSLFADSSSIFIGSSSNEKWSTVGMPFCGTLDFAAATTASGMKPLTLPQFDGSMSLMGKIKDMSGNGAHAELKGSPTWVFSTAPRSVPKYTVAEDSGMIAIPLLAADADSDVLKYYVTHLPENGQLYLKNDDGEYEEIESACPAAGDAHDDECVCDPIPYTAPEAPMVYFKPGEDEYGTALVQYVADDGMVMSDPTYIVIDIEPVNDLPVLTDSVQAVAMEELSTVVITLGTAEDPDPDTEFAYVISTLPTKGKLYQYPMVAECMQYSGMPYPAGSGCHDIAGGGEIVTPGAPVMDDEHRVVYVPTVNGEGAEYDLFGFQVTDGNVGTCQGMPPLPCPAEDSALPYFTAEGLVKISVGQVLENSVPVAGHAGYALEFDGVDDMVVVNLDSFTGPFTLELWVRTSSAVDEFTSIATMVASGADPDYINLHLTRFGAIGLDVAVGGEVRAVYSFTTINDGLWHHVAAFFDGSLLGIVVDGDLCDSCSTTHPSELVPIISTLSLGPASPSAFSYLFAGQLDDIRLWNVTLTEEDVQAGMNALLHGDEAGLVLWYPLDGESTKNNVVRDDAAGGLVGDGDAMGDIKWVASTAPIHTLKYDMEEDTRLAIDLYGTDADFDPLQFYVMSLPSKGSVFPDASAEEPVKHVPYLLPGSRAYYEAPLHNFGGPAFDGFRYGAYDGSAFSNEAKVMIDNVLPASDMPVMYPVPGQPLEVSTGDSLVVTVKAMDPDLIDYSGGDMMMLKITSLPATGALYQLAADGVSMGEPILLPNTPLTSTSVAGLIMTGKVMYVPDQDFSGGYASTSEREMYSASFGVAAQDMNSAYLYGSDEKIVKVSVTQKPFQEKPLDITAPLGLGAAGFEFGLAGQAVLLDGEESYIVGDNTTENEMLWGEDGSFTLDMYFKTTAAVQERTVLVSKAGAFNIVWRRYFGLSASVITESDDVVFVGAKQQYNDGAWHHVAVAWDASDSSLAMYVDSMLVDEASDANNGTISQTSGPLTIGSEGDNTKTQFFSGFVDEFKVWGAALDAQAVADSYRGMPNGDEEAPLKLHYIFNQATVSSGQTVVDSSGNGFHATFMGGEPVYLTSSTPVYMKKVVVTQDTPKTIRLAGSDIDFDSLDFRITQFPSHGELITGGATIDYVPYKLPAAELTFVPGPQAADDTTFTFVVSDGKVFSAVATVVLNMVGLPDGPTALPVPAITSFTDVCGSYVGNNRAEAPETGMNPQPWWDTACEAGEVALYEVTLAGYDADGDNITFHITTLPQIGRLYQATPEDSSKPNLWAPVTAPGTDVVAQDGNMATIWYSLQDVDYLSSAQEIFFGYAVSEEGNGLTSVEQTVAVMLTQRPEAFSIYSGIKGYAVYFDGTDAAVEAPVEMPVSDFTVETWFKSSGALLDGATLLSTPAFRLGWTSYGGLGMHFFGVASNLHSHKHLNDGEWHHVAVTVDRQGPTVVYIDGEVAAERSQTPGLDLDEIPMLTIGRSAMPQGSGVRTQFRGQLDEVRLWTRALSEAEVIGQRYLLVEGGDPGLAAYLRFNRGDLVTNLTVRDLAASGNSSAVVDGTPHLVTSSAPVMMLAACEENSMVLISLTGGDEATGMMLQAIITEMPEKGTLYHAATMEEIKAVPAIVNDPLNQVIFKPDEHTFGDEDAVPTYMHSVVRFVTAYTDTDTGETSRSDEDTIVVVVTPVNYPPMLEEPYTTTEVGSYDDVLIELEAEDMDGNDITFVITTLPTFGVLYQTADGVTRGPRVTAPGTVLQSGADSVLYSPILVDNKSWGQFTTYFGYTAFDMAGPGGSLQYALEPEALVMFDVVVSQDMQPPVAGDASWALMFPGFGAPATVPPQPEGALENMTALTVEMWMKSSAALARVDNAVLLECEAFRLEVGRILGVSFTVTSTSGSELSVSQAAPSAGASDMDVNDGAWHFVAATYRTNVGGVTGATQLELYMDGEMIAMLPAEVPEGGMIFPAVTSLQLGNHYAGLIDEVRMWNRALVLESWLPSRKYNWDATGKWALTGNEPGLLAYLRFNEVSAAAAGGVLWNSASKETWTGFELGSGSRVRGAAPFGDMLQVAEDTSMVYCMQGSGEQLLVTLVPEFGKLFQSPDGKTTGAEIEWANTVVSNEDGCVVYLPDPDFYGADSFAYLTRTEDGMSSVEVTVAAIVAPVNDLPEIVYFDKEIETHRNVPATVTIVGADVDHPDTVSITLTALPYGGYLTYDGQRIASSPFSLPSSVELTYVPVPNLAGEGEDALYDDFTFAMRDPDGASSATITIPITVYREQALNVDLRTPLDIGDVGELPPAFTLGLWVKADPLGVSRRRGLLQYQVQPPNRGDVYVDFATTGMDVGSMAQANFVLKDVMQKPPHDVQDGQWHHIAAVFDGHLKNVYVDGRLDTSQAVTVIQPELRMSVALGASDLVRSFLTTYLTATANATAGLGGVHEYLTSDALASVGVSALIDDVRIYGKALGVQALLSTLHQPPAVVMEDPGLLLYSSFNKETGSEYVNLNAAIAGEAGYALAPSAGSVVVINDDITVGGAAFTMDPQQAFTVNIWFRTSRACSSMGALVSKGALLGTWGAYRDSNVGGQWTMQYTSAGGLGFHIMNTDGIIISANTYETYCDGAWHMATGIYDGEYAIMYIDGQYQNRTSMGGLFVTQAASAMNAQVIVGGDAEAAKDNLAGNDFGTSVFYGFLDDLKVWNYERSQNQLLEDYFRTAPTNTTDEGLRAWYRFNEARGTEVLPDTSVADTQQSLGTQPRSGSITGGSDTIWVASTMPVKTHYDVLGFTTPQTVPIYAVDADGDIAEPVVTKLPTHGSLWVGTLSGELLRPLRREGEAITRFNTADGLPVYADAVVYIPGEPVDPVPSPYDEFAYAASDGREVGPEERFSISVFAVNEAPQAFSETISVREDTPTTIRLKVLEPEGQSVHAQILTYPEKGTLSVLSGSDGKVYADDQGDLLVTYTPALDDVSVQEFTFRAVDSEGAVSTVATITLVIECVNDPPVVLLARDTQETYRGQKTSLLIGISVFDVDSANEPNFTVTVSVPSGALSPISSEAAIASTVKELTFTGSVAEVNVQLGLVYFFNSESLDMVPVTITAYDNHNECLDGPQTSSAVLSLQQITSPFDNVAFTDDGRAIKMVFTCEVDITPFEGSQDCSLVLQPQTLEMLGAYNLCYATGSLVVNPLSRVPCPVCSFDPSDRRTYTINLAPGASITPGDTLATRSNVLQSTDQPDLPPPDSCPLGDLLEGDFHRGYILPVNPPLNAPKPSVELDGPNRVGRCNPIRINGLQATNALGRLLTYTWSLTGPEPVSQAIQDVLTSTTGPLLELPADIPFGFWTVSVTVTNWLQASSEQPAEMLVEKVDRPIPTIYILGPDTVRTKRNLDTNVRAFVEATLCPDFCNDATALTYGWNQISQPFGASRVVPENVTSTGVVLSIPANLLEPTFVANSYYEFEVRATDCVDPTVNGNAVASVNVIPQDLTAVIFGGDRQFYLTGNLPFVLDGSYSTDPDNAQLLFPGQAAGHLVFSWSAFEDGIDVSSNFGLASESGPSVSIPPSQLSPGVVTFSLTLTSSKPGDNRIAFATATVTFTEDAPLPDAFIYPILAYKLDPNTINTFTGGGTSVSGGDLTYEWSIAGLAGDAGCVRVPECEVAGSAPDVTDTNVVPGGPYIQNLAFNPYTLLPGRYALTLKVCETNGVCNSATETFVVNSGPSGGSVSVTPLSSSSCEGSEFIIMAHGFTDVDIPVGYSFGFFDDTGEFFALTGIYRITGTIVLLPSSAVEVGVKAIDGLNTYTLKAAPGEVVPIFDCPIGGGIDGVNQLIDELINVVIPVGNGLGDPDLVLQGGFIVTEVINEDSNNSGMSPREVQEQRDNIIRELEELVDNTDNYDEEKVLQGIILVTENPEEVSPGAVSEVEGLLEDIINTNLDQYKPLSFEAASLSVRALSNLIGVYSLDGVISQAENEKIFEIATQIGRGVLSYSLIPTRVPLTLPAGNPPLIPSGADRLVLQVSSAAADDSNAMLSVGSFDLPSGTIGQMTTTVATADQRRRLIDLSGLPSRRKVVLVSPNFQGTLPPPVNVYSYIQDPDGAPITPVVGLRALTVPDCPAPIIAFDYSNNNRLHCETWFASADSDGLTVSAFEEPIPTSLEPITLSIRQNDGVVVPQDRVRACKAVIVDAGADSEWTMDTITTDLESSGESSLVCASRTFGDFAGFSVPAEPEPTSPPPPEPPTPTPSPPPPPVPTPPPTKEAAGVPLLAIVLPIIIIVALLIVVVGYLVYRKRKNQNRLQEVQPADAAGGGPVAEQLEGLVAYAPQQPDVPQAMPTAASEDAEDSSLSDIPTLSAMHLPGQMPEDSAQSQAGPRSGPELE